MKNRIPDMTHTSKHSSQKSKWYYDSTKESNLNNKATKSYKLIITWVKLIIGAIVMGIIVTYILIHSISGVGTP